MYRVSDVKCPISRVHIHEIKLSIKFICYFVHKKMAEDFSTHLSALSYMRIVLIMLEYNNPSLITENIIMEVGRDRRCSAANTSHDRCIVRQLRCLHLRTRYLQVFSDTEAIKN